MELTVEQFEKMHLTKEIDTDFSVMDLVDKIRHARATDSRTHKKCDKMYSLAVKMSDSINYGMQLNLRAELLKHNIVNNTFSETEIGRECVTLTHFINDIIYDRHLQLITLSNFSRIAVWFGNRFDKCNVSLRTYAKNNGMSVASVKVLACNGATIEMQATKNGSCLKLNVKQVDKLLKGSAK